MTAKYFDWFEGKWLPKSKLMGVRRSYGLERELIKVLIEDHIENRMEAVPRLYAMLLIKTLCQNEPELMEEFGQRILRLDVQRVKERGVKKT